MAAEFDDQITELVCELEDAVEYLSPYDWPEECDDYYWELGPEADEDLEDPTPEELREVIDMCDEIQRRIEHMIAMEQYDIRNAPDDDIRFSGLAVG